MVSIVAVEKQQVLHIVRLCVALVIQHATRMRSIILSSVVCLAIPYFYLINGTIFVCVWSASRSCRLYPRERPGTHCTGGWVGPGAGLDRRGKSPPTGIRSPDLPARSESLYRLRHPGS